MWPATSNKQLLPKRAEEKAARFPAFSCSPAACAGPRWPGGRRDSGESAGCRTGPLNKNDDDRRKKRKKQVAHITITSPLTMFVIIHAYVNSLCSRQCNQLQVLPRHPSPQSKEAQKDSKVNNSIECKMYPHALWLLHEYTKGASLMLRTHRKLSKKCSYVCLQARVCVQCVRLLMLPLPAKCHWKSALRTRAGQMTASEGSINSLTHFTEVPTYPVPVKLHFIARFVLCSLEVPWQPECPSPEARARSG